MSIYHDVIGFIAEPDPAKFNQLALAVFRHQVANVAAYREYCHAIGAHQDSITRIEDIPPVSTLAFKYARLAADETSADQRIFLTSGTTIGRAERGTHVIARPEIYRASALAHLERMMFPDRRRMRILAMHPTADRMPESSLSQMISWCIEEFGLIRCECVADRQAVDAAAAWKFLKASELNHKPVCILGTTASLGALFAYLERQNARLALRPGSRIMDTGGAKGQTIPLDAETVCARASEMLGIAPSSSSTNMG